MIARPLIAWLLVVAALPAAAAEAPTPVPRPVIAEAAPEPPVLPEAPPRAVEAAATGPEIDAGLEPARDADPQAAMGAEALAVESIDAAEPSPAPGLVITRFEDGALTLAGVIGDEAAERLLLSRARTLAGVQVVSSAIRIAEPGGLDRTDLDAVLEAGFAALSEVETGVLTIEPAALGFNGVAADEAGRERARAALGDQPWRVRVDLPLPRADPYRFLAERAPGAARFEGHAPDIDVGAALTAAAADALGMDASGALTLAQGMPDEDWPLLVEAGLNALATADKGRLLVENGRVSLSAEVADGGAERRLRGRTGADWALDITVIDPAPDPELTLTIRPGSPTTATGRLPRRVSRADLDDMIGPLDVSAGLANDGHGDVATWQAAIDALSIAVPRIEAGQIVLADRSAHFEGALKDGFSASELSAALRATLGSDWETGIELSEAPLASRLVLVKSEDGVDVDGIVPDGIEAGVALASLGQVDLRGLAGGGDGDGAIWSDRIDALARALRAFDTGLARLEGRAVTLSGTLGYGHAAAPVAAWLEAALGPEWTVTVDAEDRPAEPGAERTDFITGHRQVERDGVWVTEHDFLVTPTRCTEVLDEARAGNRVVFNAGSARISKPMEPLLDRFAAVLSHCLAGGRFNLEIGGHTDDRGDPTENRALSEARALAIAQALTERGVPAGAIRAIGHGQTMPVADNGTSEGRDANRRISFNFAE